METLTTQNVISSLQTLESYTKNIKMSDDFLNHILRFLKLLFIIIFLSI